MWSSCFVVGHANVGVVQNAEEKDHGMRREYGSVAVREESDILSFRTKQPVWNEDLQAWTLNFDGRVKQVSIHMHSIHCAL